MLCPCTIALRITLQLTKILIPYIIGITLVSDIVDTMVVLIQITGEFESTPSLKYTFSYTNVNYYHTLLFLAA